MTKIKIEDLPTLVVYMTIMFWVAFVLGLIGFVLIGVAYTLNLIKP